MAVKAKKVTKVPAKVKLVPTDRELVKKFSKGCLDSFNEIVSRYETKVFNLAMGFTRNIEDAEEVLQDVFVTVYRKIEGFQGKSAFSSWLYRITVNAAFMKLRKRKQNQDVPMDEITPAMEAHWLERGEHNMIGGDKHAMNNELKDTVFGAINRLPDEYRIVFMLRDVDGLTNKEVGEILGLSIPAVKSRLHRSRLMLRRKLQRYYDDYVNASQVLSPGPRVLQGAVANA